MICYIKRPSFLHFIINSSNMLRFVVLTTLLACAYASLSLDPGSISWRIVGGSAAADGAYPYQISLRYFGSHSCGGSILDETTILTAAHCVAGASPGPLTVVTGTNKLKEGGDVYQVASLRAHPDWNTWTLENDVAIIKLKEPIKYNEKVQPIELDEEEIGANETCVLSGWGRTSYPGFTPNALQFIELKTISFEECYEVHNYPKVHESQVCTYTKAGQGACHGDSGGPLVRDGKQIGIVSWGQPCAIGYPDVFTRVSTFYKWIKAESN